MEKPDFEKMARQASPRKDFERVWPDEVNMARHAYIQGLREALDIAAESHSICHEHQKWDVAEMISRRIAELEAK